MFAAQDKQPGEKNKPGYTLDSLHRAVIERLAKRVTVIPVRKHVYIGRVAVMLTFSRIGG